MQRPVCFLLLAFHALLLVGMCFLSSFSPQGRTLQEMWEHATNFVPFQTILFFINEAPLRPEAAWGNLIGNIVLFGALALLLLRLPLFTRLKAAFEKKPAPVPRAVEA